jgi:predicted DsbA family dithiol-disulfide isomerase
VRGPGGVPSRLVASPSVGALREDRGRGAYYAHRVRALRVEVWSDIACPWCYVGKRRLEAAIARMPAPADVEVVWRAFELDPSAPRAQPPGTSYAERLARKYGTSVAEADAMIERMTAVGAADGLSFRFDRVKPGNTFDAHRVLHLALERGAQAAVKERLLRAYMSEGESIGDPEVLAGLGAEAGLDPDDVRRVLVGDAHAQDVRADEAAARRLGIHGVPFFLVGGVYGVSGAQPVEVLYQVLAKAWAEASPRAIPDGAVCGPDGCC